MKNKEKQIKERGITLIALVVTIIILLILAGVAIGTVTGDNGLFKKAKESVNTYKDAEKEEKSALGEAYNLISDELPEGPKEVTFKVHCQDSYVTIKTIKSTWDRELIEKVGELVDEAVNMGFNGLYGGGNSTYMWFLAGQRLCVHFLSSSMRLEMEIKFQKEICMKFTVTRNCIQKYEIPYKTSKFKTRFKKLKQQN